MTADALSQYLMPMIYLLLALQVLDLATTLYVLRTGKGAEANPIARKLMDFFGPELGLALPKLLIAGVLSSGFSFSGYVPSGVNGDLAEKS